jgi:hypothetical protein
MQQPFDDLDVSQADTTACIVDAACVALWQGRAGSQFGSRLTPTTIAS